MEDPARIPQVIGQLQRAWEAQPDLSLATLFGMLETHGVGWGTDDQTLLGVLAQLEQRHPTYLAGYSRHAAAGQENQVQGRYLVETESPDHRVTLDPYRVGVRRVGRDGERLRPGLWEFERIRTCRPGLPLVIADGSGIDHRLGIVVRITLLDPAPTSEVTDLTGLQRRDIDNGVYHLQFDRGDVAVLDHGLEVYSIGRRAIEQRRHKWSALSVARAGEPLIVAQPGGEVLTLGTLEKIVVLES